MVVITGVNGLTGANLIRLLLEQGRQVRGLVHRDRRAVEGLDIELVQADIRDPASLRKALVGADAVYHLAARISLGTKDLAETEATNVQGTRNVVDACLACGVRRLVHFSSIHALEQAPLDQPLDEGRRRVAADNPSPYDRSKAQGELVALEGMRGGLEVVILQPDRHDRSLRLLPLLHRQGAAGAGAGARPGAGARRLRLGGRARRCPGGCTG